MMIFACSAAPGWTCSACTTPKRAGLSPDVASVPEPKTMGYAFDDGPNCSHNAFYDYLTSQKQKATFFYIGRNVINWPLQAQRAIADGHEVCAREYCSLVPSVDIGTDFCEQTPGRITTVSFLDAHGLYLLKISSVVTAFKSEDAFAELWYSVNIYFTS